MYVQQLISELQHFWQQRGCSVLQPLDLQVGAGTFHPATTLRALGPEPWSAVYVQPSRRPGDGRYGRHPNRLQRYYQLQVVQKPSPDDFQQAYLDSLDQIGISGKEHDIRFVEDDWESPTLGAWGLGWEVWVDGMEITQFTYFQEVGGIVCAPVMGEITYGIERLAMFLQECDDVYALDWSPNLKYGELYQQNEKEQSFYNFELADVKLLLETFNASLDQSNLLLEQDPALVMPAYEAVLAGSHTFNLLDARGHYSVEARAAAITQVREQANKAAAAYCAQRTRFGHPLIQNN